MIEARRYRISGRVQGVGFRMFTYEAATREGLSGYVRNWPDGSVEALVEGDVEALARFDAAMWRGPAHARVTTVEFDTVPPSGQHHGFALRGSF